MMWPTYMMSTIRITDFASTFPLDETMAYWSSFPIAQLHFIDISIAQLLHKILKNYYYYKLIDFVFI